MVVPANQRGWGWPGAPGSDAERKYRQDHLTRVEAGGVALLVRKEVADLFVKFINELTGPTYNYVLNVRADDWGYANRDVRGMPGVKSNHAWGLAVDLNSTTNPMTDDGRTHTDLPPGISKLAAKYGLRWGGDYSGRKDPMHFEFTGTPADAQDYVRYLSARPATTQTTTTNQEDYLDMGAISEDRLRTIIREEVSRQVTNILRGEQDGQVTGNPNHLKGVRADLASIKEALK